jgi:toxin FitB
VTDWLLDTNVVSEVRRPRPEPKVLAFLRSQPLRSLFVSTVTFAEIRFGIERQPDAGRRAALALWLAGTVRPAFDGRVFPASEEVLLRWRLLMQEGRHSGHTYSQPDLLIAATALQHDLTVVSRDVAEYRRAGVPVLSPWTDSLPS